MSDAPSPLSPSPAQTVLRFIMLIGSTPARFAMVLAVYMAALFILRLALFPGGPDDDGEMLYYTQSWAWAYKTGQPPLYAWIVLILQSVFGPSLAAVVGIKYVFLGLFYWFGFLAAGRLMKNREFAVLAPLGLMACWFIGWEAAVNYSHTVMLMAAMAAVLWLVLRLEDNAEPRDHLWLGLAIVTGLLAKFNFLLFLLPLVAAAVLQPSLRPRLLSGSFVLTLAASALIAAGVLNMGGVMTDGAEHIRQTGAGPGGIAAFTGGLWQFLISSLGLLSPFLVFALGLFPKALLTGGQGDGGRLLERFMAGWLVLAVAAIAVSGVGDVRNNWLVIWFPAVFYLLLRIKRYLDTPAGEDRARRLPILAALLLAVALAIPGGMTVRALIAPDTCRKCNYFIPYADLARELRTGGFLGGTIVGQDWPNQLSGNLRRYFPDSRVISTRWRDYTPPMRAAGDGQCLLIWKGGPEQGGEVRTAAQDRLGLTLSADREVRTARVPLPRSADRAFTWSYLVFEDKAC